MKTAELTALGIDESLVSQILAINGKDIENAKAAKDKELAALTSERDSLQSQLDTATTTLKKFEGINPEQIQSELQTYKAQAEEAEKRFHRELTQRDQKDWITAKLDEYGVKSPFARRQIITEVMSEGSGLKWAAAQDGHDAKFYGFEEYMTDAKAADPNLYQSRAEKEAAEKAAEQQKKAPKIVGPTGEPVGESGGAKYVPPKIF